MDLIVQEVDMVKSIRSANGMSCVPVPIPKVLELTHNVVHEAVLRILSGL